MASIFNALHIGYTGLDVAQRAIDTTSHNISNAESEGYTRQRVVTAAAPSIQSIPGKVGNGAEVTTIKRVFDNFVFEKYSDISSQKEYSDFEKKTLEELSTFFPEIDGVGIKADLQEYYNMWQTFSDNPDNDAIKLALAKQTQTLSSHITQTQEKAVALQSRLNNELGSNINEVNTLAKELASLNLSIDNAEIDDNYTANDLRDRRNVIERSLSKLIGSNVTSGQLESNIQIDSSSNTKTGSYTLSVNGFNIVDGSTYHPLNLESTNNQNGFFQISYERQDGVLIPMDEEINGGKIGSILNLRGASIDTTSGIPTDGVVQNVISELNAFANGLIESTNNIYARSSTTEMSSNIVDFDEISSIVSSGANIKEGSFNLVVYDIDGNIAASREITIDVATSMGSSNANSIKSQMQAQVDDNADGNANNDIDDYLSYNWGTSAEGRSILEFRMDGVKQSKGYTFSIEDNLTDDTFASGTNFAGAIGLSRFFEGSDATDITLNNELKINPTLISAGESSSAGDHKVALSMMQHQFENFDFNIGSKSYNTTAYGMFDIIATDIGISTNTAITQNESINAQFNSVENEYASVSKVSLDEEMTNLIKYQTAYGASAKIITTIDQMMQTLLGIKQ